ncbi:uncharacterized protein BX663DRAFT_34891 [Cokeromyces recurvatus]|uniref:uncharacterized protein n=1 Tax=Cokeromyces recurvatus TaxID=90255 RepID=UPI00221EBB04|nr:uncharacterized protein BX663DRAFT_34891 [Cokeromyces recurvatus]KAI7903578.1 hypothetical protein BX663DRAFT_34891 [Cokeromyces recurvatus]
MRYQQSATTNTADTAAAAATITTAATTNTADADADADAAAAAATTTTTIATTTAITTTTATTNNNNNNNNNNSHNNNNNNSPVPGSIDNGENDIYFTSYNYRSSFNNRNQLYTSDTLNTSYDPKQEEATTEEIINNNEDLHTKNSNPSIEGSLKYNFISNESSTENPWTDDSNKSSLSIELSSNFEENIKSLSRDRKRSSHYQLQQRERKRIKDGE